VCKICRGYIVTYHKCPDCGSLDYYYGYDDPDFCACGYVWPDISLMKEDEKTRIDYYLSEVT